MAAGTLNYKKRSWEELIKKVEAYGEDNVIAVKKTEDLKKRFPRLDSDCDRLITSGIEYRRILKKTDCNPSGCYSDYRLEVIKVEEDAWFLYESGNCIDTTTYTTIYVSPSVGKKLEEEGYEIRWSVI